MNSKLGCRQDFNLIDAGDREEVGKYLSDFVRIKSQEAHCDQILEYHDYKSEKIKHMLKFQCLLPGTITGTHRAVGSTQSSILYPHGTPTKQAPFVA